MNSGKVFGGSFGLIDSTNWLDTRLAIGVRSFSGSIGMLEYTCGLIVTRMWIGRDGNWACAAADRASAAAAALNLGIRLRTCLAGDQFLSARASRHGAPAGGARAS